MNKLLLLLSLALLSVTSCKKTQEDTGTNANSFPPKKVLYLVKGSHFRLNFIDSNSVFQRDRQFSDSFHYEFKKGPGAGIGMSVYLAAPDDQITYWAIYIDDKLYANAFSEGGAYLAVPYD